MAERVYRKKNAEGAQSPTASGAATEASLPAAQESGKRIYRKKATTTATRTFTLTPQMKAYRAQLKAEQDSVNKMALSGNKYGSPLSVSDEERPQSTITAFTPEMEATAITTPKMALDAARFKYSNVANTQHANLKALRHDVYAGLNQFNQTLYHAADWIVPDEWISKVFGVENKVGRFFEQMNQHYEDVYAENERLDRYANETVAAIGDNVITPVTAAVPNLAVAILSGGATVPAQVSVSGGSALTATVGALAKNPSFWLSFAQAGGGAYTSAKESGATELEAQAVAWLTAFPSAAVEIGGGVEQIPNTKAGVLAFVKNAAEEGGEEVLQGMIEQVARAAVFEQDKEWFSLTDTDAVFSGSRALQEFIGGVTVATVLNGGTKATQYAYQSYQYTKLGEQFISGDGGYTIDDAIAIGLSNAKGTDAYNAAVKLQQKVQAGKTVSPYAVGRMVAESQTEQAQISRSIEREVLESGKAVGYDAEAVDTVARAAVALNQRVRFAGENELENANNAAEYHRDTDTVLLNPVLTDVNRLIGGMLAHEMTHTAEGTKQLQTLAKVAQRMEGADGWRALQEKVRKEYADAGVQLSDPEVQKEALAAWIGEKLFTNKSFAKAVADGDANVGNAFFYMIDRVRRALGTKKASPRNLAMLERLFMQALDNRTHGGRSGVQGAFMGYDPETGRPIYASNFPLGTPKAAKSERILKLIRDVWSKEPIPLVIEEDGKTPRKIEAQFDPTYYPSGEVTDASKLMGGNRHGTASEQRVTLDLADDYYQIASDAVYNYSKAEEGKTTGTHRGVTQWHYFINDILFQEYGQKETTPYRVTINVKERSDGHFVYSFNAERQNKGSSTRRTLHADVTTAESGSNAQPNTNVAQNATDVNTQSMQEGAEISAQGALLPPEYRPGARAEGDNPSVTADAATPPFTQGRHAADAANGADLSIEEAAALVRDGQWTPGRKMTGEGDNPSVTADAATPSVAYGDTSLGEGGYEAVQIDEAAAPETALRSGVQNPVDVSAAIKANRNGERHYDVAAALDVLETQLGAEELLKRMYNAAQMNRPTGMVEIDGRRVDAGAYMDAYAQSLPDDVGALEQTVRRLEAERAAEIVRMQQEGTLEEHTFGGLKIDLQLFAATRKWELLQLDPGENGKEVRQFYEKRLRGTDANHSDELVELLSGRSETYNPIANEKTLRIAKDKMMDPERQAKLLKRLGRYNPRDLFTAQDVAAATVLINKAINDGDIGEAADMIIGLSRKGTEAGRAVQAFSMMARMTPEGTLRAAVRTLQADADHVAGEGANEGLNLLADDLVKAIAEAEEEGLSSEEIAQRIRKGDVRGVEGAARYGVNSSTDIHNMLAKIRSGDFKQKDKVEFGKVPDAIVKRLREVTGTDVTGYKMVVEARALDHLLKRHGADGVANQSLANDTDVARMGDVLANPDDIRQGDPTSAYFYYDQGAGKNRPSPTVIYEKGEGAQSYYVIHTIADSKKKTLYVVTAFIGDPGYKKGAQQFSDGITPEDTAKTAAAGTPTAIIPQGEGQVKADVKMTREQLMEALTEDLEATEGNYLSKEQIGKIVEKAVNDASNVPEQLKRYVQKKIRKDDGGLAQRIYEVYQKGHLNSVNMRRAMEEALGLPTLTDEDVKWVVEKATEIQSLEKEPVKQADAMDELYDYLGAKMSVNGLDRLQAWRKFGMLANVKTHLRNILSNAAYSGIRKADDAVAMALERIFVRDRSQRGAALGWSHTEHGQSILSALQKQSDLAVLEMQKRGAKYEQGTGQLKQKRKFFGTGKVGEALNTANRWNSDMLEAEDVWFFRPAYIDALGQMMTARGVTEITPDLHERAMQRALEATFRADNAISEVISSLKRFQNASTTGERLFGHGVDVVIPFHKTPANIATQTILHSPVGIVKGAFDLYNATKGKGSRDVATAINTMAKGVTGTALLAIGLLLGKAGLFNVGFGKTEKERAADEAAGLQDGSFVIGGVSVSLDWLQPAASPLIVGASIGERLTEDGLSIGDVFGAVMDGTDSLFEMTMLQSLYDVLGGYDAGASATALSVAENVVSQSVPTLVGQVARAIDPVQRKTTGDTDFETLVNQVMAKVPGLTYLLDPELDMWGNEVYRTGKPGTETAVLNALQQLVIPANTKVGTGKGDAITEEILRLYEEQGGAVIPTTVSRDDAKESGADYVDVNRLLGGAKESGADYVDVNRLLGGANRLAVEEFVGNQKAYDVMVETGELTEKGNPKTKKETKYYRDMTDEERRKVLSRIYSGNKDAIVGEASEKTEDQLTDSERYFRDLIRRVQSGQRGTFGAAEPAQEPAPQQQQASTSYFDDLLRRMRNNGN